MQKFYKYFTWVVLIIAGAVMSSTIVSSQNNTPPPAQSLCNGDCCNHQVFVIDNSGDKTVHAVYDFTNNTVSTVQFRRGFSQPEVTIQTKKLNP